MGDMMKKQVEKFESDYDQIFAKGTWNKEEIEMMKDLQKLMYYLEVRCAMKEGGEYPGSEYMDKQSYDMAHSYARGQMRNPMNGRYMSDGRSGIYPMHYNMNGMSGRRYYDDEKDTVIHELHRMMESKTDPEVKMAIQDTIRNLEMK